MNLTDYYRGQGSHWVSQRVLEASYWLGGAFLATAVVGVAAHATGAAWGLGLVWIASGMGMVLGPMTLVGTTPPPPTAVKPGAVSERRIVIVVSPDSDIDGTYVAHCLDLDVVTFGRGVQESIVMAGEAVQMVLDDARDAGVDPFAERRPAPEPYWVEAFVQRDRHGVN